MASEIGGMNIVLSANAASFSEGIARAQRQLDQLAGTSRKTGHATVSSMQASSASLRLLEGGLTNNLRAAERFLSFIPGMGNALKKAFPVVGALALGGLLVDMGTKVAAFIKKTEEMPNAITTAFRRMHDSAQLSNDDLRLTNDRLQNEIAKLENKPQSNLAIAIDETRIAADKLSDSLDEDLDKVTELLKANKNGPMAQLLGQGTTAGVQGSIEAYEKQLQQLGYAYNKSVHAGDMQAAARYRQQLDATRQSAIAWSGGQIAGRTGYDSAAKMMDGPAGLFARWMVGDQSNNLASLRGFQQQMQDRQDQEAEENRNAPLVAQKQRLEAKKAATEAAKRLAGQQNEERTRQLQAMQQDLTDRKAIHAVDAAEEYQFWQSKSSAFQRGTNQYREVSKSAAAAYSQMMRETNEQIAEAGKHWDSLAPHKFNFYGQDVGEDQRRAQPGAAGGSGDQFDLTRNAESMKGVAESSKSDIAWLKSQNELHDALTRNSDDMAEYALRMATATGQMSRMDGATARAALHQQQYSARMAEFQAQIDAINGTQGLSIHEKQTAINKVVQDQSTYQVQASQQAQQDAVATGQWQSGSAIVGVKNALDEFVLAVRDTSGQLKDIVASTIQGFNSTFANSVMAHANSGPEYRRQMQNGIAGQFRSLGAKGLDMGLGKAEGGVLGAFGFGSKAKRGEAPSAPLYVSVVNAAAGASPSMSAGGLLSGLPGAVGDTSSTSGGGPGVGGAVTGITASVLKMIPGFASGGAVSPGTLAMVGEQGPELAYFGGGGHVTANSQLSSLGGGGTMHHTFNIDARGSQDPAATEAAVNRALQKHAPTIIGASVAAMHDYQRRTPSTRR